MILIHANVLLDVARRSRSDHRLTVCSTDGDLAWFAEITWENPLAAQRP